MSLPPPTLHCCHHRSAEQKRCKGLRLLSKIAKLDGRPESWFYGISEPMSSLQMLLRQTEQIPLSEETKRQLVRFTHFCEEIAHLRKVLKRPIPQLPTYPVTRESLDEQARQAARAERERLGLGDDPAPYLPEILESHGIPILRLPMPEGCSQDTVFLSCKRCIKCL